MFLEEEDNLNATYVARPNKMKINMERFKPIFSLLLSLVFVSVLAFGFTEVCSAQRGKSEREEKPETEKKKEKAMELGKVTVTATRTPHLLKDTPVETAVITKEEIEHSSAQTISELLRYTPGLFIRAEDAPGISAWRSGIRGLDFNSGYGLILIDGQRVKSGGMGEYGYGLNQIPLEMIDRIEVVKGTGSSLYGSDALAGVVNIITKSIPQKPAYGAHAAYGTHNTRNGGLYWSTKANKLGILVNANREESEMGRYGVRKDRKESYLQNRVDSKLSYHLTEDVKLSLGLTLEENKRKREYKDGKVRYEDGQKARYSPGLKATLDDGSTLMMRGYWYNWGFDTKEYKGTTGFTPREGDMYYKEAEFQYSKLFGKTHLLTLGGEYLREVLDYNLAKKTIDTRSVYFQDEIDVSVWRPIKVALGSRLDSHSQFGAEICPRLSSMLEATDHTRIRASVGRGFKSPTIRQLYYDEPFHHGTYWFKSNPDLDAEYSWGYSLGLEQLFLEDYLVSLTFFRNDLKDKVVRVETDEKIDDEPVKTYKNVAKCHTQGVESGFNARIYRGLSMMLSYTFLDTEEEDTQKELPYNPRHTIGARLTYKYQPWGLIASIDNQYVGKMYKDTKNTKETEDYFLTDVKLVKKLNDFATISVEGNNIFNSDYGEPERDWWGATYLARLRLDF